MILESILLFQTVSFSKGDVILLVLTFDRNVYIDLVYTGFYRARFSRVAWYKWHLNINSLYHAQEIATKNEWLGLLLHVLLLDSEQYPSDPR